MGFLQQLWRDVDTKALSRATVRSLKPLCFIFENSKIRGTSGGSGSGLIYLRSGISKIESITYFCIPFPAYAIILCVTTDNDFAVDLIRLDLIKRSLFQTRKWSLSTWRSLCFRVCDFGMTTAEVPPVREERRFTDLIREGKSLAKTDRIRRLVNSLQWRHKYQNADHYSIKMLDESLITVQQVSNGEILGLGTGVSVWPAAHVLCKYLEKRYGATSLSGQRVCDIGSGTGCTGFVAAALGAHVTLTDQLQILPFLEGNKQSICNSNKHIDPDLIAVERYDWGESAAHLYPPFDIVLISDCVLPKLYPILPLIEVSSPCQSRCLLFTDYDKVIPTKN